MLSNNVVCLSLLEGQVWHSFKPIHIIKIKRSSKSGRLNNREGDHKTDKPASLTGPNYNIIWMCMFMVVYILICPSIFVIIYIMQLF